jgi:hypothetical protein
MRRLFSTAALFALLCTAPAAAADPLASLSYLTGTWNCTYNAGTQHMKYTATYSYVIGNDWIRESDTWTGAGDGDIGLTTYEPKSERWTEIVADGGRSTTLFVAKGSNSSHRVYHSVYPNALFTLTFDRVSDTVYTLHFHGMYGGKMMTSHDICTKR